MSYTIPQIPTTATTPAVDDYLELGGATSGSRKFLASTFVLTTDPRLDNAGTVTSVQASGGSTGLSFSGGPITASGTLILAGTLAVANGGTGTNSPSLVAGNSIALSGSWPAQTVALSGTPNIGAATGTSLALSGDISGAHFVSTLTDGSVQYRLVRTGTNAREYGLAISAATGEFLVDDLTASASRFRITAAGVATIAGGLVGTPVGASSPSTGAFTTLSATGGISALGTLNALRTSDSLTNATTKQTRWTAAHYLNAEEDMMVLYPFSDATTNTIAYGGGASANNAATKHDFYTAANNTTTTGTLTASITSTGLSVTGATTSTEAGTGDGTGLNAGTTTAAGNAGVSFWTAGTNRWTNDILGSADAESIRWRKRGAGAGTYMTLSTTGLAVTGTLSSTGAVTGSNLSGTNTGDQTITLTGDVTGAGTGSFATTIGAGKVTNAMLAGSIDLTSKVTGVLPVANGGTGASTAPNALTALGAYPASNPNGYTSNTGTVTSVSVVTANGVSGSVADPTTTPAITLTLGDISAATSKPTGTGSVARSFAARAGDVFNVKDFGASPSATAADNLTAFNAAAAALLTAGGGCLEIPDGTFALSAAWTITKTANSQSVCIRGHGCGVTKLHFSSASNGIEIIGAVNQTEGASTSCVDTVEDLSICASQAGTYKALKVVGKNLNGSSIGCLVRRISIEGYVATKYWDTGIHLVDCPNAAITDVRSNSAANAGDGILLESSTAQTVCNLSRVNIQGHDFGLRVIGNDSYEGVTVHACTFVAVNTGIFWNTTTGEEQFNITDCHINPKVSYIVVNNCERVWVTNFNGLIDQRGGAAPTIAAGSFVVGRRYKIKTVGTTNFVSIGASASTVGVSFVATGVGAGTGDAYQTASIDIRGSCRQSKVTDSCIVGSAEDYAIVCQSPLTSFTNNSMLGHNVGIFLDGGSNLGTATGNQLFDAAGSARAGRCVQDNGTGNVVEYSGSLVWDPASLISGQQDTTTVSVPGAVFGSTVSLGVPYDLQGLTATCSVFAADVVRITLYNSTGGTIDLGSGTWRIRAISPGP